MKAVEENRTSEIKRDNAVSQDIQTMNREQAATRYAMYRDAVAGMGGIRHEGV